MISQLSTIDYMRKEHRSKLPIHKTQSPATTNTNTNTPTLQLTTLTHKTPPKY